MKNNLIITILLDIIIICISWYLAYLLRFNFHIPFVHKEFLNISITFVVINQIIIFQLLKFYKSTWKYFSINDLLSLLGACAISSLIMIPLLIVVDINYYLPRSIIIINFILLVFFISSTRLLFRIFFENKQKLVKDKNAKRVLIIGTDSRSINISNELTKLTQWRVLGLFDLEKKLENKYIYGFKIFIKFSDVLTLVNTKKLEYLILASTDISNLNKNKLFNFCNKNKLKILSLPNIDNIFNDELDFKKIRTIEIEDILGRDEVNLKSPFVKNLLFNKTIFISGAGGSIGSEITKQVFKCKPKHIICFDLSEFSLYKLEQKYINSKKIKMSYFVGDIKNSSRLSFIFRKFSPSIVFHAAAYKHVPLLEKDNIVEALTNNVFGTFSLANISIKYNVYKFIHISTDKAVKPSNIMGASKKLAELICQSLHKKNKTFFSIVRFGNVLGSSGSVIPKFKEQIENGGPITVTHPEITRFFMSIPEAAKLVLHASSLSKGGDIFILDMGKPIKISDLAKDMINLSTNNPSKIKIKYTGLRPGEKLYEELLEENEKSLPTSNSKITIAKTPEVSKMLSKDIINWIKKVESMNDKQIKLQIKKWVKNYSDDYSL